MATVPKLNTTNLGEEIPFKVIAPFEPMGDQPHAIADLAGGIENGQTAQVLLGATGTGKTYTMAKVIERVQRPTLVIAHNKTLAAQLASEFKSFFPNNYVGYFVSYYDYYQPEAYIAQTDTYIEKDASINDEIDELRHSATCSLFERRDVIIVASVSCIYGLGSPESYHEMVLSVHKGQTIPREEILQKLVSIRYERNDIAFERGRFRVRGDVVEIFPAGYNNRGVRIEMFGDEVERIIEFDVVSGEIYGERLHSMVFPASHYVTEDEDMKIAMADIRTELEEQLAMLKGEGKLLEAQRLEQRTNYDLEMMQEMGYCSGIENYSRHLTHRKAGETPYTLLDYFPEDFLIMIDESHVTLPQIHAMYGGDRSRKVSLVDNGFRLPSAFDNRPLTFDEFAARVNQIVYVSATPGKYEMQQAQQVTQQIIRPTGLLDPVVEVRPLDGQIDDLLSEIRLRIERRERVLVTTLTKRMAEHLTDYLREAGVKVRYLHSDIATIERAEIIHDLRAGEFDVLVGINLLREGLDMPEVSLIAILDADKEGFLRSDTSLIQTIGRAARNASGHVIMYGDVVTGSMRRAIDETERRREIQEAYNKEHGIVPKTIVKPVVPLIEMTLVAAEGTAPYGKKDGKKKKLGKKERENLVKSLLREMQQASRALEFERAAELRDMIVELEGELPKKK
ncbi:excinuclease ABC, B subunit [Selenomonas sp. oral taxon 137 str. F0430]|uniref:excinuclease ABC subunit UvrB n=1 Tax=Selenomonas sp. oral taxon 137 TaxID=712531 RepID=UPI0001EB2043|nr:excinuclease ABC subunit UvrB [Selenomonas sp. oral taxon 137]EFR40801.1 excinuclease ABC, B subunit [Selenomonas sp. oral taxon 137 str. F0430]